MPGPDFQSGYAPNREVFSSSNVPDAFMKGLGDGNLSTTKDIFDGLNQGLDLATKANKFIESISPQEAERKRLELEVLKGQAAIASSQGTAAQIKQKADTLSAQDQIDSQVLLHKQEAGLRSDNLKIRQVQHEAIDSLDQINDTASFQELLKQQKFSVLRTDEDFGKRVVSKAKSLLIDTPDPQDQVNLLRAAEAASPGSTKEIKPLLSPEAQKIMLTPVESATIQAKQTAGTRGNAAQVALDAARRQGAASASALLAGVDLKSKSVEYDPEQNALLVRGPNDAMTKAPPQILPLPKEGNSPAGREYRLGILGSLKQMGVGGLDGFNVGDVSQNSQQSGQSGQAPQGQQQNGPQPSGQAPADKPISELTRYQRVLAKTTDPVKGAIVNAIDTIGLPSNDPKSEPIGLSVVSYIKQEKEFSPSDRAELEKTLRDTYTDPTSGKLTVPENVIRTTLDSAEEYIKSRKAVSEGFDKRKKESSNAAKANVSPEDLSTYEYAKSKLLAPPRAVGSFVSNVAADVKENFPKGIEVIKNKFGKQSTPVATSREPLSKPSSKGGGKRKPPAESKAEAPEATPNENEPTVDSENKKKVPSPRLEKSSVEALPGGMPPKLQRATVQVESNFNPTAVSKKGAYGTHQVMTSAARDVWGLSKEDYSDKEVMDIIKSDPANSNLIGNLYYAKLKKDHPEWNDEQIMAAYNGGPTRLARLKGDISKMPEETRLYVKQLRKLGAFS